VGLARYQDGGSAAAFAGLVGKYVENAVDRSVGGDNTKDYACDGSEKNDESNQ
jgi:hypothetical protein